MSPSQGQSAARAALTRVSLTESGDKSLATMESSLGPAETPSWSSYAQAASLTNALTALTLAGVPVANTTLDEVVQSLRRVGTVTTVAQGAEAEFTLRPRNCRQRIVDRKEESPCHLGSFLGEPATSSKGSVGGSSVACHPFWHCDSRACPRGR